MGLYAVGLVSGDSSPTRIPLISPTTTSDAVSPSGTLWAIISPKKGKGIQHIVDTGCKILGSPIIFGDISRHKVLAYSKNVVV